MKLDRFADVMERFAETVNDLAVELRGHADGAQDANDGIQAAVGREVEENDTTEDTLVEVPAGDLWCLVNRSRKMIRLAREGKIPNLEARGPLSRAIKALKRQGLVRKPRNLRDQD